MRNRAAGPARVRRAGELLLQRRQPRILPVHAVRKLNSEDYAGACAELLRWRFFQGKDCAQPTNARLCGGLATRREAEYRQCIEEAS